MVYHLRMGFLRHPFRSIAGLTYSLRHGSVRTAGAVRRLSKKKARRGLSVTVEDLFRNSEDQDRDTAELCAIVSQDALCSQVLSECDGSEETLRDLLSMLERCGAGQWTRAGSYIPYMAIAEPWSLEYLLHRRSPAVSDTETAYRIVVFYQDKKTLEWLRS